MKLSLCTAPLLPLLFVSTITTQIRAQRYEVGEPVKDFTSYYCANDSGEFRLWHHNGAVNGGDYRVVWLSFFNVW